MARVVPVYTAPTDRYLTDFFGLFQELPVSDAVGAGQTNVLQPQVVDQQRVATVRAAVTGVGVPGNDRRLYLLDPSFQATDAEAYLTYSSSGVGASVQSGVVLRVKPGGSGHVAPLVWQNILFGLTGNLLPGAWEFTGAVLTQTNQQASPAGYNGFPRQVLSATGDGTTATVTLAERHLLDVLPEGRGVSINNNTLFPGNPFVVVAAGDVLDPFSFRVPHATVGTQAGGTVQWPFWPPVYRTLAVRLVGSTLTAKQWPTDHAPEPAWTDTVKGGSVVLPSTLLGGVPLPSGAGRAGFVLAHLGGSGALHVRGFEVNRLA